MAKQSGRKDGTCSRCGIPRDGKHPAYCKACYAAWRREWRVKNPGRDAEVQRAWNQANPGKQAIYKRRSILKNTYGLSEAEYEAMIVAQKGRCAICKEVPKPSKGKTVAFHVDHDHETGKVRGLLCANCNPAVGLIKDSPERAMAMAWYLLEHQVVEFEKEEV